MNPLDFTGPDFLMFYVVLYLVFMTAGLFLRKLLSWPGGDYDRFVYYPYEAAYLAGGEYLAVTAAITKLVHLKVLRVRSGDKKLESNGIKASKNVHPLDKMICDSISPGSPMEIAAIRTLAAQATEVLRDKLQENGWIPSNRDMALARYLPLFLVLCVPVLGAIKFFIGVSRHRPVGILLFLICFSLIATCNIFYRRVYRSRLGELVFEKMKRDNAALETTATTRQFELSGNDLVLAISLFGVGILSFGPLQELKELLTPSTGSSSCSSGSSCGGGGGCGGGCGGCGGGGD